MSVDPIRGVGGPAAAGATRESRGGVDDAVFGRLLADRLAAGTGRADQLRFSGHAVDRVKQRGIDLGPEQLARLEDGVNRAAAKGGRDALVLVDRTAFVVSVRNRTVVTAVDSEHMKEQVFTNIDSAVIA